MVRAESKKRGESSREKEIGEESEKASKGEETTKGESREADEGREGMVEAKRGKRCLLSGSRWTGSGCVGIAKELVEEGKSGTISISSI